MTALASKEESLPLLGDDRFELQELIGRGGMAKVYRGVQKSVGRRVAIKVLADHLSGDLAGVTRFVREARLISRLQHPNIVSLIEFGRSSDGKLLLVMELLEGQSLREVLKKQKRLPPERAVLIGSQILSALKAAHGAGVVHRDLKPENVFVQQHDDGDLVKVLDFGVAKLTVSDGEEDTTTGALVGTLRYMAPEQIAGAAPDPRMDLYAVGVLLYEMLAGGVPFRNDDRFALLRAVLKDPAPPLTQFAPNVSPELSRAVMHALEKRPDDRFATADEMRSALLGGAGIPLSRGTISQPAPPPDHKLQELNLPSPPALPVLPAVPTIDELPAADSGVFRQPPQTSLPMGAYLQEQPPSDEMSTMPPTPSAAPPPPRLSLSGVLPAVPVVGTATYASAASNAPLFSPPTIPPGTKMPLVIPKVQEQPQPMPQRHRVPTPPPAPTPPIEDTERREAPGTTTNPKPFANNPPPIAQGFPPPAMPLVGPPPGDDPFGGLPPPQSRASAVAKSVLSALPIVLLLGGLGVGGVYAMRSGVFARNTDLPPTPREATTMVEITSTPPGAVVRDATSNAVLCRPTPCRVPVARDGLRAIVLELGSGTKRESVRGDSDTVTIDLQSLVPLPPPPPAQTPNPNPRHPRIPRRQR